MPDKIDPLLLPAAASMLLRRAARDAADPPQFKEGTTLVVTKPITGKHQWDRGMAGGLASVTLEPGDVVECLRRAETSDLSVLPLTDDIGAFVERSVNAADRRYVERHRLVVEIHGRRLNEHFRIKET